MRLDRGWVLGRVVRPNRYVGKAEPCQQSADAAFGQFYSEAGLDHARQIRPPPADNTVLSQVRTRADEVGDCGLLIR